MKEGRIAAQIRRESVLFIFTLLYSFCFGTVAGNIMHFPFSPLSIFLLCLLSCLLFSLMFFNLLTFGISAGVLLILSVPAFFLKTKALGFLADGAEQFRQNMSRSAGLLGQFFKEGFSFFNKTLSPQEKDAYRFFAHVFIIVLVLLTFLLIQKLRSYWIPSFFLVLLLPLAVKYADSWALAFMIPLALSCFFMILLSSGHLLDLLHKQKGLRQLLAAATQMALVLLLAALLAILSVSKLSYSQLYSPFWQGVVDDLMTLLPEGLQPKLTVTPFSLADDGYYPLGSRLGGPVELNDEPNALIQGHAPSLIKVQSSDFYDGLRWQRVLNNPNYRYSSPFNGGAEMDVFNDKPAAEFMAALGPDAEKTIYQNYAYSLTPLRGGVQLLFVSGTPTELHSHREEALLFYFNQAGTIFAKAHFDNEHPYDVETYCINPYALGYTQSGSLDSEALSGKHFSPKQLENAYESSKDEAKEMANRRTAYKNYLQLPDLEPYKEGGSLKLLADELTQGLGSNYTKTQALLNFFTESNEFVYTLDVDVPPDNSDFVSYFMKTRSGYCTYYASAMTMLARLSGVPARYVEGYALSAKEQAELKSQGSLEIRSENAHAWTEVYLDGLGWVPVDPTPGGVGGHGLPDNPEPTPSPTPTPTPTPPPEAEQTTTPPPEMTTTSPEATTAPEEQKDDSQDYLGLLLTVFAVVLLLLLLFFLLWLYVKRRKEQIKMLHDPSRLKENIPDNKLRADFYWKEILNLHRLRSDKVLSPGLTERQTAAILAKAEQNKEDLPETKAPEQANEASKLQTLTEPADWEALAELTAEARYSLHHLSDADLLPLAEAFDRQEEMTQAKLGERRYLFRRILPPQQGKIPKN